MSPLDVMVERRFLETSILFTALGALSRMLLGGDSDVETKGPMAPRCIGTGTGIR